jgi:hypothetical protein
MTDEIKNLSVNPRSDYGTVTFHKNVIVDSGQERLDQLGYKQVNRLFITRNYCLYVFYDRNCKEDCLLLRHLVNTCFIILSFT